jgi:hypothetical protein
MVDPGYEPRVPLVMSKGEGYNRSMDQREDTGRPSNASQERRGQGNVFRGDKTGLEIVEVNQRNGGVLVVGRGLLRGKNGVRESILSRTTRYKGQEAREKMPHFGC